MAVYTLPDLPYDYSALEPSINGEIIELHHDKHHKTYVDGANATLDKLEAARGGDDPSVFMGLEKTLAFNLSGHILHSIYWENMSPDGGGNPEGELSAAIDEYFGSWDALKKQLKGVTTTVQGSGWGVLAYDQVSDRLLVEQIYDHQGNAGIGNTPLLVIDAWEHAWYLQYKNVKADYVDAFWNIVNWQDVAKRFAAARG